MNKIEFDLSNYKTKEAKANALMNYIANRAGNFDRKKFKRIVLLWEDNEEGLLGYSLGRILNVYTQIPVYIEKKQTKVRFWEDNMDIQAKQKLTIHRYIHKKDTLVLDCISNYEEQKDWSYPMAFLGFDHETLAFIANTLYHWNELPPLMEKK